MTARRVLLRIKKLRKYLDRRIREERKARDDAGDDEGRQRAAGRVEAYQDVREEMIGDRLASGAPDDASPEEDSAAAS